MSGAVAAHNVRPVRPDLAEPLDVAPQAGPLPEATAWMERYRRCRDENLDPGEAWNQGYDYRYAAAWME